MCSRLFVPLWIRASSDFSEGFSHQEAGNACSNGIAPVNWHLLSISESNRNSGLLSANPMSLFPLTSKLQGTLSNRFADGLIGGNGVGPFRLRFAQVKQEMD